jgi:HrpA-like RNA helicase
MPHKNGDHLSPSTSSQQNGEVSSTRGVMPLKRKREDTNGVHRVTLKLSIQAQRKALPIYEGKPAQTHIQLHEHHPNLGREAIISEVQANDTVVILGETGSGKTTRMCISAGILFSKG